MWAKVNILLVICILGLFLVPSQGFACHLPPEKPQQEQKSCCSEMDPATEDADTDKGRDINNTDGGQDAKDSGVKDCCKDGKHDSETSKDHGDDCGKHCNEKSCRTSVQCNPLISFYEVDLLLPSDTDQLKLYTLYKQPFCSDAYFSIWQPPKIA